jgi:hypothetical protein
MTNTATATVEVLTAEVRVLMVGSRQVTQSVFRQLDEIEPGFYIEPFGRVSFPDKSDRGGVWVVGTDWHGNLCRAYRVRPHLSRYLYYEELEKDSDAHEDIELFAQRAWAAALDNGEDHHLAANKARRARCAELAHDLMVREGDSYREWKALPLIVLAGLR